MMLRTVFRVLATAIAWSVSATALTGQTQMHTMDDVRGWEAVGRLDIGARGFCTGALIGEDLVLTAAHCLYDSRTLARVPADEIVFRAGFRDGRALAERRARRVALPAGYVYSGPTGTEASAQDIALIALDQPIRSTQVRPFSTAPLAGMESTVGIVSYAHDRSEAPALQEVCGVLGLSDSAYVLSCQVDFGASGAPVFQVGADGEARVVSVISAKAVMGDEPVALATQLTPLLEQLSHDLRTGSDFQNHAPGRVRVLTGGERAETGARFVRP